MNSRKYYRIHNVVNYGTIGGKNHSYSGVYQSSTTTTTTDDVLWQFVPYSNPRDKYFLIYNKRNKRPMFFHGISSDYYNLYTQLDLVCSPNRKFKIVYDKTNEGCNIVSADNALRLTIPSCNSSYYSDAKMKIKSNGSDC